MKDKSKTKVIEKGKHKGELGWGYISSNLQDTDFWAKCWLVQKDTLGSRGLYYMEEDNFWSWEGDDKKGDKCIHCAKGLKFPVIKYPDEILNMFKEK